jgi:hypothetical protein
MQPIIPVYDIEGAGVVQGQDLVTERTISPLVQKQRQ